MNLLKYAALIIVATLLWQEISVRYEGSLPSSFSLFNRNYKKLPSFNVPTLFDSDIALSNRNFHGQVSLLNIWASWCPACMAELPMLMRIKENYNIPIYSLITRDNPVDAKAALERSGNPYELVGIDESGEVSTNLEIEGTPTIFVIDAQGIIRYKFLGAINDAAWENEILPV